MRRLHIQWWVGPTGRKFTTLHLSRRHARRFRKEVALRLQEGTWNSTLAIRKIVSREVANKVRSYIATRLAGRNGIRANVSEFQKYKMV
jgi:hypothetical protein